MPLALLSMLVVLLLLPLTPRPPVTVVVTVPPAVLVVPSPAPAAGVANDPATDRCRVAPLTGAAAAPDAGRPARLIALLLVAL
jgi:hypothetical protein